MATSLDDGLFQGGGKVGRNRKERQLAKRMFTLFGNQTGCDTPMIESDTDAQSQIQLPSLKEAQASPDESEGDIDLDEGDVDEAIEGVKDCPTVVDADELKRLQREDPTLSKIREQAEEGNGDCFWQYGLLYRSWRPAGSDEVEDMVVSQLVLPVQCRSGVLKLAHDIPASGHLGRRKTLARIQQRFFWPGISRDVAKYCRCCPACQKSANRRARDRAPMVPVPVVDEPFKRIAMDIVGPLNRSRSGNRYILVVCDYATRYPEAVALKSTEAVHVAEQLWKISRVGEPQEILTDQGSNFTSQLLKEVYRMIRVNPVRTSPYHPQTDGLVERFNGTLKGMLRRLPKEELDDWDNMSPYLLFAYREVSQESTGFSPFEMLYGHRVRGPLDILKEFWEGDRKSSESIVEYVLKMRRRIAVMKSLAHENQIESQRKQKTYYDRKARDRSFGEGDKVLVLLPSSSKKLAAEWQGPYMVRRPTGPVDYEIDMKGKSKRYRVFHVNMLREWHSPDQVTCEAFEAIVERDDIPQCPVNSSGQSQVIVDEQLSAGQRNQLDDVVTRYSAVFCDEPGHTDIVEHQIDTGSTRPVRQKPYRIPRSQEVVQKEIQKMMDMDVIQESRSDWASPIVLVPKRDGSMRF